MHEGGMKDDVNRPLAFTVPIRYDFAPFSIAL